MTTVGITAIGTAVPKYKRTQNETVDLISSSLSLTPAEKRLLRSIYKATGIHQRHSVLSDYECELGQFTVFPNHPEENFPSTSSRMKIYQQEALPLALNAIENCLTQLSSHNITHVITISCTGMYAPGLDIEIAQKLKLSSSVQRTAINFMGCYAAFNGLKFAKAICHESPSACVLIVCVELCSLHFQKKMSLEYMVSNSLFADGAAAVIVQANPKSKKHFALNHFYCDLLPQSEKEMAWKIADTGFDIVLSSYIPEMIHYGIKAFVEKLFEDSGLTQRSIDYYAIHPGGQKILQACEEALNINPHDNRYSYRVLKQYGNMSSATVLFVLKEIWHEVGISDKVHNIFSCAFGPGLTLESMLLASYS